MAYLRHGESQIFKYFIAEHGTHQNDKIYSFTVGY